MCRRCAAESISGSLESEKMQEPPFAATSGAVAPALFSLSFPLYTVERAVKVFEGVRGNFLQKVPPKPSPFIRLCQHLPGDLCRQGA